MIEEIRGFTLITGMSIIAKITQNSSIDGYKTWEISKPVVPMPTQDQNGREMMRFANMNPFSRDEHFVLGENDIIGGPWEVHEELEKHYIQVTSGLVVANQMPKQSLNG